MNEQNKNYEADALVGQKKSYRSPQLTCYGAVAEITATVSNTGGSDGGGAGTSKTH